MKFLVKAHSNLHHYMYFSDWPW